MRLFLLLGSTALATLCASPAFCADASPPVPTALQQDSTPQATDDSIVSTQPGGAYFNAIDRCASTRAAAVARSSANYNATFEGCVKIHF